MLKISDFFLNKKKDNILSIGYLEIEHSQIVNLIGNNNSGKSLFFKTIHGEYFNFSGDIIIKEKPAMFYRKRKQTALVEVTSNLLPNHIARLVHAGLAGEYSEAKATNDSLFDINSILFIERVTPYP